MMNDEEREEALAFAKSKDLVKNILNDIETCGYIGEELNKLVLYMAMTSRKMSDPLSVLIISDPEPGKAAYKTPYYLSVLKKT